MDVIELKGLKKYYGKSLGIEDVTFSVKQGEMFGFVGPNGAGKSTAIRILLNLIFPTSGTAFIMGKDVVKESKAIKEFTSYVSSDVRFYKDMSVAELLKTTVSFYKNCEQSEVERLCNLFVLDRKKRFEELSLGNRKKVAIVSALLTTPKLLILDEPASGLDPVMQKELFLELKRQTQKGMTVLLSSHNLPEVQEYCDRVAFIKSGKILSVTEVKEMSLQKIITIWSEHPALLSGVDMFLIEQSGKKQVYRYHGNTDTLLQLLSNKQIQDFTVAHESLEDRFMNLYREERAEYENHSSGI